MLLDNNCFEGAYYLVGYAIECALKACIAKRTRRHDFPDKQLATDSYVHDLDKLVKTAGLEGDQKLQFKLDPQFYENWMTVKEWSETSRYETWTQTEAVGLYEAVINRRHGVLKWVRRHW